MPALPLPCAARPQRGFTYLSLVILVAIIGLVGAAGLKMGALLQRNAAERELLDIGAAFSDALQSYARATPPGQPQQPASLKDLLKDPRVPGTRRHLRKIFVDPITGRAEWGLMYLAGNDSKANANGVNGGGNGIVGVYSLSPAKPVKVGNFEARFQQFAGKDHLSDWKFTIADAALAAPALTVAPPLQPVEIAKQQIEPPPLPEPPPRPEPVRAEPPPEPVEPLPEPVPEPE